MKLWEEALGNNNEWEAIILQFLWKPSKVIYCVGTEIPDCPCLADGRFSMLFPDAKSVHQQDIVQTHLRYGHGLTCPSFSDVFPSLGPDLLGKTPIISRYRIAPSRLCKRLNIHLSTATTKNAQIWRGTLARPTSTSLTTRDVLTKASNS